MLHCLRGECDVFNGDPQSAVVRTPDRARDRVSVPGTWGYGFCLWNAAYARLNVGDEEAAIALFMEMHELASAGGYGIADMCGCQLLGEIWESRGDLETARAFWELALDCRRELGALRIGHVHGSMPTGLLAVARVAEKQGDLATASELLREGIPLAEEMREVETATQMVELLRKTSQVEPTQRATLRPEGGVWHIEWGGTNVHVPDLKGLWHLRELVARPHQPVPALSLIGASSDVPIPRGDAGPMLDREALRQYRQRLAELDDELDHAALAPRRQEAGEAKRGARRADRRAQAGDRTGRQAAAVRLAGREGAAQRDQDDPPRHHRPLDNGSGARRTPGRVNRDGCLVLLRAADQHHLDVLT